MEDWDCSTFDSSWSHTFAPAHNILSPPLHLPLSLRAFADLLGNFSVWPKPIRESAKEKLTAEEMQQMEEDKKEAASRAGRCPEAARGGGV